jgi:DNA-binding MarR family transcriptional regulator
MHLFLTRLTKSRNALAQCLSDHIVELGLSANELLVLWTALDPAQPTAAEIRRHLGMRQSTFTSLIARLVWRGYVKVRPAHRDRRTRYIELTRPGFVAVTMARTIQRDLEAGAQPHDADAVFEGLGRLAILTGNLPAPILMDDGLPEITA